MAADPFSENVRPTPPRTAQEEQHSFHLPAGFEIQLVACEPQSDHVVGWASLNSFNPRAAYDHVADISVYVDRAQRGRGIGEALLQALEQRAHSNGFHKLVLAAFPTNGAGMRLYERRGFRTVGIYVEQGLLDGRWVDVIVMEKLLS